MVERPEKLDLFMSCVFALYSYSKTSAIFNYHLSIEEQGECISYLGSVVGTPTIDPEEMIDICLKNVNMLKSFLGIGGEE